MNIIISMIVLLFKLPISGIWNKWRQKIFKQTVEKWPEAEEGWQ